MRLKFESEGAHLYFQITFTTVRKRKQQTSSGETFTGLFTGFFRGRDFFGDALPELFCGQHCDADGKKSSSSVNNDISGLC